MKIYLELLGEGTPVWRPVEAVHIQDDLYRISQVNAQRDDECWPFETDSIVRCMSKTTQEGDVILVAYERANDSLQS
jgi:hypothetical protein